MRRRDLARPSASEDLRGTWWVLVMASVGMTMVAYNTTAAITILPSLRDDFGLRPTSVQWVMAIYTLSAAALMPVLGRLADLVGKMKVYFAGLAAFGLGALLVTLAQGVALLMIGRLGQGIGAACLVSTSLAVLSAATPEKHRPFVLGLWDAMIALGMSLGPIIAGLLTEYLSWRMIFVSDLALVCISAAIAIPVMRAGYVPDARDSGVRLDYAGAATLMLLLGPLAYALTHGQDHGWSNPVTLAVLAVAIVAGIAFFLIERHKDEPLSALFPPTRLLDSERGHAAGRHLPDGGAHLFQPLRPVARHLRLLAGLRRRCGPATDDAASGAALQAALRAVQDDAFDHTMLALAVVGVVGAVLAAWLLRGAVPASHSAGRPAKSAA